MSKYIDIKKVIGDKNPKLLKWLPGFMINFMRSVIHEDDINRVMNNVGHLYGLDFTEGALRELNAKLELVGLENVPKDGGVILAANHPMGGLDGIAFMSAAGRVRSDIQFLVNDILLNIKNFEPLFIPVNKHGNNPRYATKMIEEAYASDQAVLVFPAGLVSRKINGKVQDLEWKKSFISKSVKYNKDIVPVFIGGRNSNFFYYLSKLRRFLGIKANIEMLFLPKEMFKQKDKTITIIFGKPIPSSTFDKSKSQQEWADYVREVMYNLPQQK